MLFAHIEHFKKCPWKAETFNLFLVAIVGVSLVAQMVKNLLAMQET